MNLRFLRTIIAISQTGSLSAAAQSLGLSHSAVSLQIKTLEDELQFQILDRTRRPPALTGEGMALVEHARRMEDVASDIRALADGQTLVGRVAIGAVPSTLSNLAAPALARLHAGHPDLRIEFTSALSHRLIDLVADGTIDCAIVTDPGADEPELATMPICSEPYALLVSADAATADADTLLATRPFVWFDRRSRLSQQIEGYFADRGIRVQTVMEVDSFDGVEALVKNDLGVSILPRRVLTPADPGIRHIALPGTDMSRRVVLASRLVSSRGALVSHLGDALTVVLANAA